MKNKKSLERCSIFRYTKVNNTRKLLTDEFAAIRNRPEKLTILIVTTTPIF